MEIGFRLMIVLIIAIIMLGMVLIAKISEKK